MTESEHSESFSNSLFSMVDLVVQAPNQRLALHSLLSKLISLFRMDQASFCEESSTGVVEPLLSLDATGRIIQDPKELWLSQTLMADALMTMTPKIHSDLQNDGDSVPKSVSEHSLRNVVCVPVSKKPNRVLFLASRKDPFRKYSAQDLSQLKTAARAAFMALQQNQSFLELKEGNEKLKTALENKSGRFLTSSKLIEELLEDITRVAPFNVSVLIQGESGSGKEELAREIHRLSGRSGSFIAINCANLTESLLESELFGYVRGAFTGANNSKRGLFQEADGGTFFLDEIAELPISLQAKLLRVLQERCVRAVGATADVPIDVRILAASHTELKKAVSQKKFRDDLYYRVQEMTVTIPPLRDRPEDIELLARHFLTQYVAEFRLPNRVFSEAAMKKLLSHSWPGNVRELKNCCRTSVILAVGHQIQDVEVRISTTDSKPVPIARSEAPGLPITSDLKDLTERFEMAVARELLDRPGETQGSVAKQLGISVRTLQRIISRDPALKAFFEKPELQ